MKQSLYILLLCLSAVHALQFKGLLTDEEFKESDSLYIEVVETGLTQKINYNKPFKLELPKDSVWNICVTELRMENGETSGESFNPANRGSDKEKCYELKYLGDDSSFSANITGDEKISWYNDGSSRIENDIKSQTDNEENSGESLNPENRGSDNITELRKVVVQLQRKPKRKIGESVVSAKSIKRMPSLGEADVMRSIQALPGVVASSDFSTKIYVRGGGSDQNLFLLDNGVVYSPAHFFGLFSTFLVEPIEEVKFYKSGFMPEYGNRLSSVAAISSRAGGKDTVDEWFASNSVKISTFAAQAHTEGHQGDARWVIAARSTYIKQVLDALKAMDVTSFSLDYKFTDIQGAVNYNLGEGRDLQVSLYTGADVLNLGPMFVEWGNTVVPVNLKWRINENLDLRSSFSYSLFYQDMEMRDMMRMFNDVSTFASRQSLTFNNFENHTPTVGYDLEYSEVTFLQDLKISKQKMEEIAKPWHHILYAQDIWRIFDFEFQYGMRFNYHALSEQFGLEPRFSAKWGFTENQSLNFHAGYYEQYLNSLMLGDQESLNEFYYPSTKSIVRGKIKPSSSVLTTLGYTFNNIFDMFNFNTEAYYKTQNNLLIFNQSPPDSIAEIAVSLSDFTKSAEGYSLGYEVSLSKPEGFLTGGLSWSQGLSVVKEDGDKSAYYPNWHQPFSLKLDLGVNWFETKYYLRSSAQLKWSGGTPYTEYLGYHNTQDIDKSYPGYSLPNSPEHPENTSLPLGDRNGSFKTDYFRVDLKLIDWGKENKWNFGFTILNLTNHENVFFYSYDTSKNPPKLEKSTQFPFFPALMSYEYYF